MFIEVGKNDRDVARPPFKSVAVPRPIAWISTLSKDGIPNLAPFSQFTNLGFRPPYVLLSCNTNADGSRKDTVVNIEETGEFVHNMATYELREAVSLSGAPFPPKVDEFEKAGLTKVPAVMVKPFRVAESPVQLECRYTQSIRLPGQGPMGTVDVIIGRVVGIHIQDDCITEDGKIDIEKIRPLARLGYTDYASIDKVFAVEPSKAAGAHSSFGMDGGSSAKTKGITHNKKARYDSMANQKLLSGVNVLELSTYVAASTCGRQLAALGADVIKVESQSGDDFRHFGKSFRIPADDHENPLWDMTNGGKRSVVINLKTQEGLDAMHRLLEKADVFLTNNREKALKKNGLDYETLKERYPRLIYATITGFGDLGPEKDRPGFDGAAFWARSGFLADMSVQSETSYPVYVSSGFGDTSAGTVLMAGINAALFSRERTGKGDHVTASLYGTALWNVAVAALPAQKCYGYKYPKTRYEVSPAPFQAKDGEWILPIMAVGYPKYFPLLCKAVDRPDLIDDPRFKTLSDYAKPANKADFVRIMEEEFAKRSSDEWRQRLGDLDVVYEVLSHFEDVFTNEQALANYFIQDHTMASGNTCRVIAPPLGSAQNGPNIVADGPRLGEHTESVLKSLGYSDDQLKAMGESHAIAVRKEA